MPKAHRVCWIKTHDIRLYDNLSFDYCQPGGPDACLPRQEDMAASRLF